MGNTPVSSVLIDYKSLIVTGLYSDLHDKQMTNQNVIDKHLTNQKAVDSCRSYKARKKL